MICFNCGKIMGGLSMSVSDTEMRHEYYCNYCHTYTLVSYNPEITDKILKPEEN